MPEPLSSDADALARSFSGEQPRVPELEQWEHMHGSTGKIREEELVVRIGEIQKALGELGAGPEKKEEERKDDRERLTFALMRELVYRFEMLERERLRRAVRTQPVQPDGSILVPRADGKEIRMPRMEAVGKVESLDWRIRWELYQEFWLNLLVDEVRAYEQHRAQFPSLANVPRDVQLEGNVRAQMQVLHTLLNDAVLLSRARHLLHVEHKPEAAVEPLLRQLSTPVAMRDMEAYNDRLTTNIQTILAQTVGFPLRGRRGEEVAQVPLVFKLRTALFAAHIDALLKREEELRGRMDDASIAEKQKLAEERKSLLTQFLSYHASHLGRQRELLHLFIEPGGVYPDDGVTGKPDLDYGPAETTHRYLAHQRLKELEALARTLDHLENGVLGSRVLDVDRLLEDLFTTLVVPKEAGALLDRARGSTYMWGWHDRAWSWTPEWVPWRQLEPGALRRLMLPVYKRFHLPPTTQWDPPTNEELRFYHDLSPAEKQQWLQRADVQKEIRSVRSIVKEFRGKMQPEIARMRAADEALRVLLSTGNVREPLAGGRGEERPMKDVLRSRGRLPEQVFVTGANPDVIEAEGWPGERTPEQIFRDILAAPTEADARGMYFRLIEQATAGNGDFEKAFREYAEKIGGNLDMHLEAADLEKYLGGAELQEWKRLLLIVGIEAASAYLGWKLAKKGAVSGLRSLPRLVRGTGGLITKPFRTRIPKAPAPESPAAPPRAPASPKEFEEGLEQLMKEVEAGKAAPKGGASAAAEGEAAASNASKLSRLIKNAGKYLGPAAIVLTAWDLKRAIELGASLEELPENKAVETALELMETHPQIHRDIPEYRRDAANLRRQVRATSLREVTQRLRYQIEDGGKDGTKRAEELVRQAKELVNDTEEYRIFLKRQFPITDYIRRNINDPEGVVRVDFAGLNGAREEGARNMERSFQRPLPGVYDELERRYEAFVKDATAYLKEREAAQKGR